MANEIIIGSSLHVIDIIRKIYLAIIDALALNNELFEVFFT